jgi:signal transduction histidine kinase
VDFEAPANRLPIVLTLRAVALLLCLAVTLVSDPGAGQLAAVGALVIVAGLASLRWPTRLAWIIPIIEGVLAAAVAAGTDPLNVALLPYLVVPALTAGLARGLQLVLITSGLSAAVLIVARGAQLGDPNAVDELIAILQWTAVSLGVGSVASYARRLQTTGRDPDVAAYEAAYRLLSQLRTVSRQLSAGLDPLTLAESMLDDVLTALPAERGVVFACGDEPGFIALAARGVRPELAMPRTTDASAWARALRDGRGHVQAGTLGYAAASAGTSSAVLPVRLGTRTIAVIGVERDTDAIASHDLDIATAWAADYAIRLDTALIFAEIRGTATAEERRRLAREIHDGVAQELASLGYGIDDLAAAASTPSIKQGLAELRQEITRIITELRLSIFDLRSEVAAGVSLTTALSDYVRSLAPAMGAEVHLAFRESGARLRFETEAELLRIAQEAITNCRRHADASNIWVSTTVAAPHYELIVEDDGRGLGDGRPDSFGMEIMRERASRIGALLTVAEGPHGGTRVRVASQEGAPDMDDSGQTVTEASPGGRS